MVFIKLNDKYKAKMIDYSRASDDPDHRWMIVFYDENDDTLGRTYAPNEFEAGREAERWLAEQTAPVEKSREQRLLQYIGFESRFEALVGEMRTELNELHNQAKHMALETLNRDLWVVWRRGNDGEEVVVGLTVGSENAKRLAEGIAEKLWPGGWEWGNERQVYHKNARAGTLVPMGINLASRYLRLILDLPEGNNGDS